MREEENVIVEYGDEELKVLLSEAIKEKFIEMLNNE